ncbi:MAG: DUF1638 domain-containing protein, partial [Phycisphaeraceae bacterium]|nr:DUF1638 domain-containing protein [Phycisphaeraceae bacterium]
QFLPGGLHDRPQELRRRLQEAIDETAAAQSADLIAVGYGVCGLGAVGIHARSIPLAIPRVHDCIALFLGSDAAYKEQFARHPGTYYISAGWIEEKAQPQSVAEGERVSCGPTCYEFKQLIETFGRQNAEDIKRFLSSWQRNYDRAAFVDTGVTDRKQKYADIAAAMAEQFGWKYERIEGTADLLAKLLTTRQTTDEVLVVQPHHVTAYDPVHKGLQAVPVWESTGPADNLPHKLIFDDGDDQSSQRDHEAARLGLGIDAGGTYTDAVIYDFERHEVIQKAKALTTKWDFAIGIGRALDQLDGERLRQVDLVSVSTTLATNAIVEGQGQKAGLLIMPPYGLFDPSDITHRPIAIVDGRMEIDGSEIAPINPDQIRQIVHDMIERQGVAAFAVTGYASHNNPAHELQIKRIIQAESDASVTCGHEVSEGLNYRIRAQTAALNARIISCLETLLGQLHELLPQRGIDAPVMV